MSKHKAQKLTQFLLFFTYILILTANRSFGQTKETTVVKHFNSIADRLADFGFVGVSFEKELGLYSIVVYTSDQAEEHRTIVNRSSSDYRKRQKELQEAIERSLNEGRDATSLARERDRPYKYPFEDGRRLHRVIRVAADFIEIELESADNDDGILILPIQRILRIQEPRKIKTPRPLIFQSWPAQ
jgi:hypothetical protein